MPSAGTPRAEEGSPGPPQPGVATRAPGWRGEGGRGAASLGFWPSSPPPRGGAAAARSRRGSGGSSPGVAEQEAGRAAGGGAARCGASARGAGGGVCAGLGGQPRRTAAAGARGAGRKSLFTQTAHRLGNNAVKEVSRLGLTAPTSCSHTHTRGKKKKKKKEEREKEKKRGKNQDLITRATDRLQTPVSMESRGLSPGSS